MNKVPVTTLFFGKLPSRGDFVRSMNEMVLTQSLDRWLSGMLELLANDARWKEVYDQAPSVHFAVLGMRSAHVVAGHVITSTDASGRRFPFLVAGHFEVDQPASFIGRAPLALAPLWERCEQAARRAHSAADAGGVMAELNLSQQDIVIDRAAYETAYGDFIDLQSVGSLQSMLQRSHTEVEVRRILLGMGLLLQPVPTNGSARLDKGLRLPLPQDRRHQSLVGACWLDLVSGFLGRADFQVLLLQPQGTTTEPPVLCVGFAGDTPAALAGTLDPRVREAAFIDMFDPAWADDSSGQDYAIKKLSSYLQQPALSLRQASRTFREAFLGE